MDDKEWLVWQAADQRLWGVDHAGNPCRDCTTLFHRDMVAGGMCDGVPLAPDRPTAKDAPEGDYHGRTYAQLREMRAVFAQFGAPRALRVEVRRAYMRERERSRRARRRQGVSA
jgi:hypothetical protein